MQTPCSSQIFRYNKYSQITARAVRASFKEEERLVAERRGLTALKYQRWENGLGGTQVRYLFPLFCQILMSGQILLSEEVEKEKAAGKAS